MQRLIADCGLHAQATEKDYTILEDAA